MRAEELLDALLEMNPAIRYAAIHPGSGEPVFRERRSGRAPTSPDGDRWEELVVNPTLIELTSRSGNVEAGGLEYVVIRYGLFFQLVIPLDRGHISLCFEPTTDPIPSVPAVRNLAEQHGARPRGR